jgi:CheY-like chemotaxis protein
MKCIYQDDGVTVIKLMMVDDSQVVRDFIRLIIRSADDIELVAEAGTGKDALDLLSLVDIDVATLDLGLPDVVGLDLLDLVRCRHDVGVVVLSGSLTPSFHANYPHLASFDKDHLFDQREHYLTAIRNAVPRRPEPVRRFA